MKLFNSKLVLLAITATVLATSNADASGKKDDWDIALLLGVGSQFSLGLPAQKDPNKNLDKEVIIPQDASKLYFADGKQLQSTQDPKGKGKAICQVFVKNNTGRPQPFTLTKLTLSDRPYSDAVEPRWEDFDVDSGKQLDKDGNAAAVLIYKVECAEPMVKNGRANLTLGDMKKAFGKFAAINPFGPMDPNPAAPVNPAPVAGNGGANQPKPDPAPAPGANPAPAPAAPAPGPAAVADSGTN